MRQDIIAKRGADGVEIDIAKAIGKGYGNFWFTNNHCRYRLLKGSRNSKKSVTVSYEIVMKILSDERRNIVCCRQNYVDVKDSIYNSIIRAIFDLGLEQYFKRTTQPLEIEYLPTGQKIYFRGMNNETSITSVVPQKGYLTDLYFEEFYECSSVETFRIADGSLRGKLPDGLHFQVTCMFNAWSKTWVYDEFFKGNLEDDPAYLDTHDSQEFCDPNYIYGYGKGLFLKTITYKINEFRDVEIYDAAMKIMKEKDSQRYAVEANGEWGAATAIVYTGFNESCLITTQDLLKLKYIEFAVGIDTGLSTSEGKKHTVTKDDNPVERVRSATTMCLTAVTEGYKDIVVLDEYYHTNIERYFDYNTDDNINHRAMTMPELAAHIIVVLRQWMQKYKEYPNKPRGSVLMNGTINVYVDSADIGFRQMLELEARKQGFFNVSFFGGAKTSIQTRVDVENAMMHYGNFLVCKDTCPNTIREFKNARRGEKGEARMDGDDHCITCLEYSESPYFFTLCERKNFKIH